jgi:predicted secreted protein
MGNAMKQLRALMAASALVLPGTACIVQAAQPQTAEAYNVVELQAEAQREVPNDLLNASLYVEANDADAARLAAALNRITNEALKAAADFKAVRVRSGGSNTHPVYDRSQKLTGWRGRAEVRLESRDFEAASRLIARLQASMQLSSISFSVSPEQRKATENELIGEAIQAFRGRAEIVRQALAGKAWKLRHMSVNTSGSAPPPRPLLRAMAAQSAEIAPPQFEGGMSTVQVSVSGAIQFD